MSLDFTTPTRRALRELSIEPNIAVKIEGLDVLFSAQPLLEFITVNCPGFFVGADGFFVGGLKEIEPERNRTLIDSQSTTFTIRQQINYEEAETSSISTMNIGLVDKDEFITNVISPGFQIEEIMGARVQVFVTFGQVSFFEDAVEIFKGFVTAVTSGPGLVTLKINHPDTRKNIEIFQRLESTLSFDISATQAAIFIDDTSSYLEPTGPLRTFVRIEETEELIEYTSVGAASLNGLVRGAETSLPFTASAGDKVVPVYSLRGNPIDLALQLMLSGDGIGTPAHELIPVSAFVQIGAGTTQIQNAIYFDQINISRDFGLRPGDKIDIVGAGIAGNNFTQATVTDVQRSESGFYVVVDDPADGLSLTLENVTSATMSTFSAFNVLPIGAGLKPDEVDIEEHIRIRDFFHSSVEMEFFLKDENINIKEFISEQLFKPIACYELPRKARSSIGYTIGPIPGERIQTLDISRVKNPRNMRITRTSSRAFFNEVVYRYDDDPLDSDENFRTGRILISQESKNRIVGIDRTYQINSLGLRSELNGANIADENSNRIIQRYQFAAEIVSGQALLRDMAEVEVGDIVIGAFDELHVSDITRGDRVFSQRLFEVQNRTINLKTGNVSYVLLVQTRFTHPGSGLMSLENGNLSLTQFRA